MGSEVDAGAEQHVAWGIGACTLAEVSVLQVSVEAIRDARGMIVHAIEDVEGVDTKLEVDTFLNDGDLLEVKS